MIVAGQLVHALNDDGAVLVNEDNRTHLLQNSNQVNNFGLNRCVAQDGLTLSAHTGEQDLLGSAHGGVVQHNLCTLQTLFGNDQGGAGFVVLLNDRTELAQCRHMVVDGAVTDLATTQVGDACGTEGVQQRAHHQNRDAGVTTEELNLLCVLCGGGCILCRVEGQNTSFAVVIDLCTVQLHEGGNDFDIAQVRDVTQGRGGRTVQCCDHRLGHQVLGASNVNLTNERSATFNAKLADVLSH